MDARLLIALLAVAGLAGCTESAPVDDKPIVDVPPPPEPVVVDESFGWLTGSGVTRGPWMCTMCTNGAGVDVPANASRMEVQVEWTCASATCEVEAALFAPGAAWDPVANQRQDQAEVRAGGAGPLAFEVEGPEPGRWGLLANPLGASADVQGAITLTLWT